MVYGRSVESRFYCETINTLNKDNLDERKGQCIVIKDENTDCNGSINSLPSQLQIVEDADGNIYCNIREYYNGRADGVEQDYRDSSLTLMRDRANVGQYYVSSKVCDTITHWYRPNETECVAVGDVGYYTGFKNFPESEVGLLLKSSFYQGLKTLIGCGAFEDSQIEGARYFLKTLESIIDRPVP